jgi:hypothetical protein
VLRAHRLERDVHVAIPPLELRDDALVLIRHVPGQGLGEVTAQAAGDLGHLRKLENLCPVVSARGDRGQPPGEPEALAEPVVALPQEIHDVLCVLLCRPDVDEHVERSLAWSAV